MSCYTPIHNFLIEYSSKHPVRAHMPGHVSESFRAFDITEIKGAGNLWSPEDEDDIIAKSENIAANLFNVQNTLFFTGGCSQSIQTALLAVKNFGIDTIIVNEFAHKSFFRTCKLLGLNIRILPAPKHNSIHFSSDHLQLNNKKKSYAFFLTSINYYGEQLSPQFLKKIFYNNLPFIIVDNAHGAYKTLLSDVHFCDFATLICESAHKTLPALTGGAYLHISRSAPDFFSKRQLKYAASFFVSTSPSYLILDSLDLCNDFIAENKHKPIKSFSEVSRLKKSLVKFGFVCSKSDEVRVCVCVNYYGYSGFSFADLLREKNIEPEFADECSVVLLFSAARVPPVDYILTSFISIPRKIPIFFKSNFTPFNAFGAT